MSGKTLWELMFDPRFAEDKAMLRMRAKYEPALLAISRRRYALHLSAHAVAEQELLGTVSHDLDLGKPCPWCELRPEDA